MRTLFCTLLALALAATAGCQANNAPTGTGSNDASNGEATSTFKVAMVLPGNITDKSWNQAGYEGLEKAREELSIEVAYSEKVAQPDQVEALGDYARRGYNVVFGHGGEFQEAADRAAERHPDTLFVVNNGTKASSNVATVSFRYRQMGYLVGYLSGKMSESGRGGFIGGQKIKFSTELVAGFEAGFMKANPEGEVLTAWTNDWDDIAKAKEAALNLISQGVDVIFPPLDNAVVGSFQAAKQKDAWAIGLYYDAVEDWPDTALQSVMLDIRVAMVDCIEKVKEGKTSGAAYEYGVDSPEVMHLGTFHSEVPDDVKAEVEGIIRMMTSGELEI